MKHFLKRISQFMQQDLSVEGVGEHSPKKDEPQRMRKIVSNKAQCLKCRDIIESKHVHDYVRCKCGEIFVDGGKDYLRRGANDFKNFKDLSVTM